MVLKLNQRIEFNLLQEHYCTIMIFKHMFFPMSLVFCLVYPPLFVMAFPQILLETQQLSERDCHSLGKELVSLHQLIEMDNG